jgi:hypothetical protein
MSKPLFIPTTDTVHFPLLTAGQEESYMPLMAADHLEFFAPRKLESCFSLFRKEGVNWHLYGDTRWPAEAAWVEFPLKTHGFMNNCGVLVVRTAIPEDELRPFAWSARNGPLTHLFREERGEELIQNKIRTLENLAASTIVEPGPDDSALRYVQSYCLFADQHGLTTLINIYTDFLNADGVPIPKFRAASWDQRIHFCRFTLHSLFTLNKARLGGLDMLNAKQLSEFGPATLGKGETGPRWAKFHPSRILRTRPAIRSLATPSDTKSGFLSFESFQRIMSIRNNEKMLELLAFEREIRPRTSPATDNNATMGAFTHRMNGSAIYVIPDGLVEEFHNTDCGEVHMGDIKLPFSHVYLKFTPHDQALLGDGAPVDGCYVVRQEDEVLLVLTSFMPGVDYERSFSVACLDPIFSLHMPASVPDMLVNDSVEDGIQAFLKENEPPAEDQSTVYTYPDGTQTFIDDIRAKSRKKRIEVFRSQEPAFRECLNIIINAACFISYKPEDITDEWDGQPPADLLVAANLPGKNSKGRVKQMEALREIANGDYTRIKLCGKALFPDQKDAAGTGKSPRAHWRRGHWRRQRHGPGLMFVVLRWIRPTLVKKESGEPVETRFYDVDAPDSNEGNQKAE